MLPLLVGLTAGRLADEVRMDFKILKFWLLTTGLTTMYCTRIFAFFNNATMLLNAFQLGFS